MNPWYFVTIPIGLFIFVILIAFCVGLWREFRKPPRVIEQYVDEHFHPISVSNVWKQHDNGNGYIDGRLYVRTDGRVHEYTSN